MARDLKFLIWEVEGLCFLCSTGKGADQLHGNLEADMCLCFRICIEKQVSHDGALARNNTWIKLISGFWNNNDNKNYNDDNNSKKEN